MKKLLFALLILPVCSFGQISLRPQIGAGYGMISQEGSLIKRERTGRFIVHASLSAIYWFDNWYASAGIGYLTTGYGYDLGTLTSSGFQEPSVSLTNAKLSYKYQHITVPVTVGRKISLQRFSLLPEAGIDLAYNLSEKSRFTSDQKSNGYKSNTQFSSEFNRVSIFTCLSLTASYKLTDRLSVFCGPSYKYMVTDIAKQRTNLLTGATISQNHHAILLNGGVYIGLPQ